MHCSQLTGLLPHGRLRGDTLPRKAVPQGNALPSLWEPEPLTLHLMFHSWLCKQILSLLFLMRSVGKEKVSLYYNSQLGAFSNEHTLFHGQHTYSISFPQYLFDLLSDGDWVL